MSEEKNSFKELEKLHEEEYADKLVSIKNSLDGNLNGISLFTNLIEIYFARVVAYFVNSSGGKDDKAS